MKMRKYVTLNSKEVQEALFKAGFNWGGYKEEVMHLDKPLIYINSFKSAGLMYSSDFEALNRVIKENWIIINPENIIKDPYQLDGAVQPEKMIEIGDKEYSESTIKAALKEYVK